eukprot:442808-Pelagomonas_calceolata.AAC.1
MREFVVDLREWLRGVWNAALAEHGEHMNKLAMYHHWMALPVRPFTVHGVPFSVPRYLHLDLGKHMLRDIARFHWSGYRPLCFRSAALVGGYSDVTLPYMHTL